MQEAQALKESILAEAQASVELEKQTLMETKKNVEQQNKVI
jgi:hypothetical protein